MGAHGWPQAAQSATSSTTRRRATTRDAATAGGHASKAPTETRGDRQKSESGQRVLNTNAHLDAAPGVHAVAHDLQQRQPTLPARPRLPLAVERAAHGQGLLGVLPGPLELERFDLRREAVDQCHGLPRPVAPRPSGAALDLAVVLAHAPQGIYGEADVRTARVRRVAGS